MKSRITLNLLVAIAGFLSISGSAYAFGFTPPGCNRFGGNCGGGPTSGGPLRPSPRIPVWHDHTINGSTPFQLGHDYSYWGGGNNGIGIEKISSYEAANKCSALAEGDADGGRHIVQYFALTNQNSPGSPGWINISWVMDCQYFDYED